MSGADDSKRRALAPGEIGPDQGRRRFFRAISREAVQAAGSVLGTASAVQRDAATLTSQLLGLGTASAGTSAALGALSGGIFRRPYRLDAGSVMVLDQRQLPGSVLEIECRTGGDVAECMRNLSVRGGPVLGELAAYAMALTAARNAVGTPYIRYMEITRTGESLREARPDSAAVAVAVERCLAAFRAFVEPADGAEIALAVRMVADAIAMEVNHGLSRLVRDGAGLVAQPEGRPLEILTIDATGPLSGGPVGTAMGVMLVMAAAGRPVHAWVAETRPALAGARLAALELRAAHVQFTVIADGAVGWLLRERRVDAVFVGAERIAINGDFVNATGTYPLAALAARHGVPLYVCAPMAAVDSTTADGSGFVVPLRAGVELLQAAGDVVPASTDALVPLDDITPADLVRAYVTDEGVLQPPFRRAPEEQPA